MNFHSTTRAFERREIFQFVKIEFLFETSMSRTESSNMCLFLLGICICYYYPMFLADYIISDLDGF